MAEDTTPRVPTNPQCVAHCPKCGSDLAFIENECICKNPKCGWSCEGCKEDDDV